MQTVRDIISKTTEFFRAKGIDSARLDAELLIGQALDFDRLHLYLNLDRPLDAEELDRARELVRRRAAREPVAYILGRKEFLSRSFAVGPGVLIPRPETELLVEHAARELGSRFPDEPDRRILEFGVGSGCIAVSLCLMLPTTRVLATEISAAAAAVARRNAETYGVAERLQISMQHDFAGIVGPFHAIVSNPPYIDADTAHTLQPEVARFEPPEALFAERHGLQWYDMLLAAAPGLLSARGFLLVEIGEGQSAAITRLAANHGMAVENIEKDYAGIERIMRFVPAAG